MEKKTLIFLALVLVVPLAAYLVYDMYDSNYAELGVFGPVEKGPDGEVIHHTIPDFLFTDQDGQLFGKEDVDGKVYAVDFFFTSCPTICPTMSRNLQSVQELYRNDTDFQILSFTVDPKRDDPERLSAFAKRYNADTEQWHFLTGKKKALYWLARKGFFLSATDGDGGPMDFIHSENIVLVDRQHRIRGYYNGTDRASIDQLVKDIAKLKRSNS